MGITSGGFYFHNMSPAIVRKSRNPERNYRDIFIGYVLVLCTYIFGGILGYYGLTGSMFSNKSNSSNSEIEQNFLNMFPIKSGIGTFLRVCAFCQIFVNSALTLSLARAQILLLLTG